MGPAGRGKNNGEPGGIFSTGFAIQADNFATLKKRAALPRSPLQVETELDHAGVIRSVIRRAEARLTDGPLGGVRAVVVIKHVAVENVEEVGRERQVPRLMDVPTLDQRHVLVVPGEVSHRGFVWSDGAERPVGRLSEGRKIKHAVSGAGIEFPLARKILLRSHGHSIDAVGLLPAVV